MGRRPLFSRLSALYFVCLIFAANLHGQATGTILGIVQDTSGAVVPEAVITATQTQTGLSRTVSSSAEGTFILPRLPAGSYTLQAEHAGFRTYRNPDVTLQVDQSVTLSIQLTIGQASEAVTVEGSATLLQTNSATLSQVVEGRRIQDMPLNGRNVLQLIGLNAGVSTRGTGSYNQFQIAGTSYASSNSISGSRGNGTAFQLDGGNNTNGIVNGANPFPNPDAVQEFSVQTNNFSAEYGNVAGGVVNVVTRSGTNDLHGSVFKFYRDGNLNARNFFSTSPDTLKRHQFGAAIGGPVVIPRIYNGRNRTFFFGAYQGTRIRQVVSSARASAFTPEQQAGDFSSIKTPIMDPVSKLPFDGNIIPVDRFDPVSKALLERMPAANVPGTNFFTFQAPETRQNDGQYTAKLDHQLTANSQLSGRLFLLGYQKPPALDPSNLYSNQTGELSQAKNASFSSTHIFSPRLLNVARFTYNYQRVDTSGLWDVAPSDLGARMLRTHPAGFITSISGYSGFGTGTLGRAFNKSYEFSDTITYSNGSHNLRFGYQFLRDLKFASNTFNGSGAFTFSGQRSGNAVADFLLGLPVSMGIRNVAVSDTFANFHSLFVQDDYRVSPHLTVNLGLRWDGTQPYTDRRGFQPYFRAGQQSQVFPNAPLGMLFPGDADVPHSDDGVNALPANPDRTNFAPRIGIVWNPMEKLVIRAAYGIFFGHASSQLTAVAAEPWVRTTSFNNPPSFSNPFGTEEPIDPNVNVAPSDFKFSAAPGFSVMDPNFRNPMTQSMNFGIEQQLTQNLLIRATYVGTIGQHLEIGRALNPAIYIPGKSTTANINQRRRYQGIGNLSNVESVGRSWYHSMQLSVTRRFARGLSFQANYTLSKSIDDTSIIVSPGNTIGPDPDNRRFNHGLSDFDATHIFVASGIWELPNFISHGKPILRPIVNGWQMNAIVSLQSGVPFTPSDSRDLALTGVGSGVRLVASGDPTLSSSRSRGEMVRQYFNTAVFNDPVAGSFGSTGRNILRGPGYANLDFSLFKTFTITEAVKLQLRGEAFNLLNRPNFNNPIADFSNPNFGAITSASAGRVLQLGLRLAF